MFTRRQLMLAAPAVLRAASKQPNVLWLMTDEQRPDSLQCYGSKWAHSPNLDRLAASGVLFESAYTPSPVCVPARCALLTGNYGSTTGVLHNQAKLQPTARLLTWEFERKGYQSASFGKKHYFLAGAHQAFETEGGTATDEVVDAEAYGRQYDPAQYDAVQYPAVGKGGIHRRWILAGKFPAPISETAEERNVNLAIRWLEGRDPAKPFLLRLSLNAPHTPVVVPEQFLRLIDARKIDLPVVSDQEAPATERTRVLLRDFEGSQRLSARELERARHFYYARSAFADCEIGRLLDWVRRQNLLDNTIVVMTADHGAGLGEHGLLQKLTFQEQVATVPLLLSWSEMGRKGTRVSAPVGTIGLLPAVLQMAGIPCPAVDAKPVWGGAPPPVAPVFSELEYGYLKYRDDQRQVMVRHGRYKMSLFLKRGAPEAFAADPDGELYDLASDPLERENLFRSPRHSNDVSRLTARIVEWDRGRDQARANL